LLEQLGALEERPIRIPREVYDAGRPPGGGVMTSAQLVDHHGSWLCACEAAAALAPDGSRRPGAERLPWRNPTRGRERPAPYTKWEIIKTIRACAEALGEWPSCHAYEQWVMERRERALRAGTWPIRIPRDRVVERVFGGWAAAPEAAWRS